MSNKILVTGAAGFIGSTLVRKLIEENEYEILGIDNFNDYYDSQLKRDRVSMLRDHSSKSNVSFNLVELDLRNSSNLEKLILDERPKIVCHLAAQAGVRYSIEYPHTYVENNITATINLLEACVKADINEFVFASTSSVYGLNETMPFTETTPIDSTISTYSSTKRACELLCYTYHNLYNINFRILRFFTVYGPWGRPDMALFLFTKAIIEGEPINIFNNGQMKRDFTYVDEIVKGFISSIKNNYKFEIFNLGTGRTIELMTYIEELESILGRSAEKVYLPMQKGDVSETWADISKAKEMLKYDPQISLSEGINEFVNWYKQYYNI